MPETKQLTLEEARAQGKLPKVHLVGEDGNAFAIMGRVTMGLRRAGLEHLVKEYRDAATAGDYDNLLQVSMRYISEDSEEDESDED